MKKTHITVAFIAFFFCANAIIAQSYDHAAGLRFGWGIAGTYKHFFTEKIAGEGIINYWNRGKFGFNYSQTKISALVEFHNDLSNVTEGLRWYYGGGAFVQFIGGAYAEYFDYFNYGSAASQTGVGISGVLGADYSFADLPINVSLDWMPGFAIVGGGGFFAGAGGVAVRYTF